MLAHTLLATAKPSTISREITPQMMAAISRISFIAPPPSQEAHTPPRHSQQPCTPTAFRSARRSRCSTRTRSAGPSPRRSETTAEQRSYSGEGNICRRLRRSRNLLRSLLRRPVCLHALPAPVLLAVPSHRRLAELVAMLVTVAFAA